MKKLLKGSLVGLLAVFAMGGTALATEPVFQFSDVPAAHPNYAAIMDLHTRGIISGYPDNSFKPDQAVNRVEALKIILNAVGVSVSASTARATFSDIDASQWYMTFLNKAVELKIVAGYPDGTFKPVQTVNLAENLKMLLNAEKIDTSTLLVTVDPFADVPKAAWYAGFIQYAKDKKLIVADGMNKVEPAQGMTRGKLAELAYRLIQVKEKGLDFFGQVKENTPGEVAPGTLDNGVDTSLAVNIKGMAFNKANMTIAQGTVVRWTNADNVSHSVTSDDGTFASPNLANGDSWAHTFNDLGTFDYHCSIHPTMRGQIIVKPAYMVPTI